MSVHAEPNSMGRDFRKILCGQMEISGNEIRSGQEEPNFEHCIKFGRNGKLYKAGDSKVRNAGSIPESSLSQEHQGMVMVFLHLPGICNVPFIHRIVSCRSL